MLTGVRGRVADDLAPLLPGIDVYPSYRTLENLARTSVLVGWTDAEPFGTANPGETVTVALWVVAAQTDPTGAADDELDAATDLVLAALDTLPYPWRRIRRTVYADTNPAATIDLELGA